MKLVWLTSNWRLKVFSLLVSLVLFVFVSVESVTPVDVNFRINYIVDDDMMLTGETPNQISTTLQGPWAAFRFFLDLDNTSPVEVDLRGKGLGTVRQRILEKDIVPPAGMRILSIRPAELVLNIDRVIAKQVPINVDLVDRPAFGFEILEVRSDPARVEVTGPQELTKTLDFVSTRPVNLASREDTLTIEVDLRQPQVPMSVAVRRVRVTIEIGEEFVEKRFEGIPVVAEGIPARGKIVPDTIDVSLRGPRRTVDPMDREAFEAIIDIAAELETGTTTPFEKTVELRGLPDRTARVGLAPKVVVELPKKRRRRRKR